MEKTEIKIFTEEDQKKDFYALMGPFFADKKFFKIFGEPLYNESGSVWFVMVEDDTVLGFCAGFRKKYHMFLNQFYMVDEHKGKGNGSKLFNERLKYFKNEPELRAMVRDERSFHLYEKNGFSVYGNRGSYKLVKKSAV